VAAGGFFTRRLGRTENECSATRGPLRTGFPGINCRQENGGRDAAGEDARFSISVVVTGSPSAAISARPARPAAHGRCATADFSAGLRNRSAYRSARGRPMPRVSPERACHVEHLIPRRINDQASRQRPHVQQSAAEKTSARNPRGVARSQAGRARRKGTRRREVERGAAAST
jgi:hypothetical protein